ncbi:MAG: beta-ketoacyl-[acyl-carrier-protein] synthase family protein [Thermoanaerobaculia bacterium]
MTPEPRRVVVTGMGAVSPVGNDCDSMFAGLVAGRSGVGRITAYDPSGEECQIAAEVKGFDPSAYLDPREARRTGRYAHFAIAATQEALTQANLDPRTVPPDRVACLISTAIADCPMYEEQAQRYYSVPRRSTSPFTVPRVSTSMAAGNVSMRFGVRGPSFGVASACATGGHSLAMAWMMILSGFADAVIAGGTESALSPGFVHSYQVMRLLAVENGQPERASRPFDLHRSGFVMGEGCGVFVLEALEHATGRGAEILAELAGVGLSSDAYHPTSGSPDGDGSMRAIVQALARAQLQPEDIDLVQAHATATVLNDRIETLALKRALGDRARQIPVSGIKSMIGHCLAGAAPLGAIAGVLSIRQGVIPPTINLDTPDPECDLDYVPHTARRQPVRAALINSFAFGGQNCSLVFRRMEG